ncbi:MAG: ABC transporter permease [Clostridia bacterium]|nr:ABC transporter permease [Clostridia bacterium]
MKNRIFSYRLWVEGLRRIRIPGFIALGFIGISAILVPASVFVESRLAYANSIRDSFITPETAVHPGLVLLSFIVAPAMALTLFSFLNRRRSSDFFHALPYSRICIFTSFFLSIAAWLCFIAVSTSAVNLAAYALFGFKGALAQTLRVLPQVLIGSILAAASVTLAMTLTGTLFSNLTVSALILYFPKICAGLFATGVTESTRIVPIEYFPVWRFLRYNLATSAASLPSDPAYGKELTIALVYSAVLAIIYFTLSCVLFVKRKSETAERSAPNKAVQTVFRIAVTMVICMPVCALLLFNVTDESYVVLIPALFLYSVALTVWVLWELITTKRWINVLKSLPYLGIVVVLNVAIVLGMNAAKNAVLDFTPAPEEIKSVTVLRDENGYYSTYDMVEYADSLRGDKVITNADSVKTVSEVLAGTAKSIRNFGAYSYETNNDYYNATLRIESTRGVRYRELTFTSIQYRSLVGGIEDGPTGEETKIPEAIVGRVNVPAMPEIMGEDASSRILSTMRNELKGADAREWRDYLLNVEYGATVNVEFGTVVNGYYMNIRVPLNRKFTPKAADEFLSAVGKAKNTDRDYALREVKKIADSYLSDYAKSGYALSGDYSEYAVILDKESGLYHIAYNPDFTDDSRNEVVEGITDELPTGEDSFYVVVLYLTDTETGETAEKTYVSAITPEAAEYVMNNWYD